VETSKITGGQGSHNKPIGCGTSGAYAPGPDDEEEEWNAHTMVALLTAERSVFQAK
jgi:hypothetical protein